MKNSTEPSKERRAGVSQRWMKLLRENWENCDARFQEWSPNARFNFRASELRQMADLVTMQERTELQERYHQYDHSIIRAANALRLPYFLAATVIQNAPEQTARQTLEMIQRRLLAELDRRTNTPQKRRKLAADELTYYLKTCRENISQIAEMTAGGDNEQAMTVITRMPFDEEGE